VDVINQHLQRRNEQTAEQHPDHPWIDEQRPIVVGIASQGYNAVMHNTRGRSAQHHEVQLGLTTAYLAGEWSQTAHSRQRQQRIEEKLANGLPYKNYADKISNPEICRDLRLENVYYVDMAAIHPHRRRGRCVQMINSIIIHDIFITLQNYIG
jgi:hypothetical protein